MCNVLVPWTNPSPARGTGVHCGTAKGPLGFHSSGPMTVKARVSGVSTLCWHASPSTRVRSGGGEGVEGRSTHDRFGTHQAIPCLHLQLLLLRLGSPIDPIQSFYIRCHSRRLATRGEDQARVTQEQAKDPPPTGNWRLRLICSRHRCQDQGLAPKTDQIIHRA